MKPPLFVLFYALVLMPVVVSAEPKKPDLQKAENKGQVSIVNADNGSASYDRTREIGHITKDVVISQQGENLLVYAQDVIYSRTKNQASATGQLRVLTRESTIRGQKLFADFNSRRFTISGDVVITSRGENDGALSGLRAQPKKDPVRVLCDQVVWDYDTRQATATGNIRIFQGVNRGTCDSIFYDEPGNIIQLEGNVRLGDDQKRNMSGQTAFFYVDKDLSYFKGITKLSFPPSGNTLPPAKEIKVFDPAPTIPADPFAEILTTQQPAAPKR